MSKGELVCGGYPSESECTQPLATPTLSTIFRVVFAPSSVSIGSVDDSLDEPGNERTLTGTLPVNRSLGVRVRSYTRFCVRNLSSASGSGTVTRYCPLTSLPLLPRVLAHVCLRSYGIFSLSTLASLISLTSCGFWVKPNSIWAVLNEIWGNFSVNYPLLEKFLKTT